MVVSQANQLPVEKARAMVKRKWSLFDQAATLTVHKPWDSRALYCELQAIPDIGYPMRLLSGRSLEYDVAGARDKHEKNYLTLIRYTPDSPMGETTAIINRRTASIEVKPDENVALVLLIASAISASLLDMKFRPSNEAKLPVQSCISGHLENWFVRPLEEVLHQSRTL